LFSIGTTQIGFNSNQCFSFEVYFPKGFSGKEDEFERLSASVCAMQSKIPNPQKTARKQVLIK